MSNYSNFDLRKFLAEGKKAKDKSMEEQEEVALSEEEVASVNEDTDILQMVMNQPELLGYLAAYGGGLFAAVKGGMSAMDYCEANPDNKLCKMWKNFQSDFSSVKKIAREKGRGYEEGVEENLNEEPVSIAAVAAGIAAIFGGSAAMATLIDKAEKGDFGPKGEKVAKHLRDMGSAAGNAIHGKGNPHHPFEEGAEGVEEGEVDESVIAGIAALVGSSLAAAKVLDWIKANYPEATARFVKAAEAGMRGAGHGGTEKGGMMSEEGEEVTEANHEDDKKDEGKKKKMDEAKFKEEIKSILES